MRLFSIIAFLLLATSASAQQYWNNYPALGAIGSGGGVSGTLSGAANQNAYFTDASTVGSNNNFTYDGSKVGVGLTGITPSATVHIGSSTLIGRRTITDVQIAQLTGLSSIGTNQMSAWLEQPIAFTLSGGNPAILTLAKIGATSSLSTFAYIALASGVDASNSSAKIPWLVVTTTAAWTSTSTPFSSRINYIPVSSTTPAVGINVAETGISVGKLATSGGGALQVSGTINLTGVGTPCTSALNGAYRDTITYKTLARCDGTNWVALSSTTTVVPAATN